MGLDDAMVVVAIPVSDFDMAKPFYEGVLGLKILEETRWSIRLGAGSGTQVSIYKRPAVERGHTIAHFEVSDIESAVADIRSRGGVFEEYPSGAFATTHGIAQLGPDRGAWLKDPDGNVLGLREGPIPGRS